MKIKKVVCAALMLSLSMSLLACVPESKSSAYEEGTGGPIETVRQPKVGDHGNYPTAILRDNETGVEYIYTGSAICPRLNRNGQPFMSR